MVRSRLLLALVLAGGTMLVGCQALSELIPTEPTPSPTPTLTPITIPVILPKTSPTPTPAPTPSPNPTASPTPTPTPTPTPLPTASCGLPESHPTNPVCTDESALLLGEVEAAITAVTERHPEYFDFDDKKCTTCYKVKNVDGYLSEVMAQLSAMGVCSYWDGEEMAVKESNSYSEQYDILLASNHIRRGPGAYRGVCRPAIF